MRGVCPMVFLLGCLGSRQLFGQAEHGDTPRLDRLVRDLQTAQAELAESQQQIQQLRKDMEALRQQLQAGQKTDEEQAESSGTSADGANYDTGFLAAKVSELHQDK